MTTRIALSEPLADLCERRCSRCLPEGEDAPPGHCRALFDAAPDVPLPEIRERWIDLPHPRCSQCEFLLLVLAIERLVPPADLDGWLTQPNVDLEGRSPADCISAGD